MRLKMRDSFIFYSSFLEALEEIPEDIQLKVYQAVTKYALKGVLPELTGTSKAIFALIKPQIDANNTKFDKHNQDIENGKKGAEYGKLGGRPKKENPPQKPPLNPPGVFYENPINVNDNVNVNVNDNVNVEVVEEEEIVEIKKQKELDHFYGEYKNVHLTKKQYDTLYACILDKVILERLINELSEAISRPESRYKPYDEKYPNAHFLYLKAFWRQVKEYPERFMRKDSDTGGKNKIPKNPEMDAVVAYFNSKKGVKNEFR